MKTLKDINQSKYVAIENVDEWLKDNEESILQYEIYKNS